MYHYNCSSTTAGHPHLLEAWLPSQTQPPNKPYLIRLPFQSPSHHPSIFPLISTCCLLVRASVSILFVLSWPHKSGLTPVAHNPNFLACPNKDFALLPFIDGQQLSRHISFISTSIEDATAGLRTTIDRPIINVPAANKCGAIALDPF